MPRKKSIKKIPSYFIILLSLFIIGFSFNLKDLFVNSFLFSKGTASKEFNNLQNIKIAIKNGCGTPKLGLVYKLYLLDVGCDVTEFTNAKNYGYPSTEIHFHKNNKSHALNLADHLGVSHENIHQETNLNYYHELTLILGQDHSKLKSYTEVKKFDPFLNNDEAK